MPSNNRYGTKLGNQNTPKPNTDYISITYIYMILKASFIEKRSNIVYTDNGLGWRSTFCYEVARAIFIIYIEKLADRFTASQGGPSTSFKVSAASEVGS